MPRGLPTSSCLLVEPGIMGVFGCRPRLGLPARQAIAAQVIEIERLETLPGVRAAWEAASKHAQCVFSLSAGRGESNP